MSTLAFELTPELTFGVFGTDRLTQAFCEAHGAASWREKSEAADQAHEAMYRVLEQAGRQIQQLYKSSGNLAVIGDTLAVSSEASSPYVRNLLRVERRRLDGEPDTNHLLMSYFLE